jgi:glycosyltransferase involved in cell wall biosynthesis
VRILHVVRTSRRRGAETFALELAAALDARGHDDSLVALGPGPDGDNDPDLPVLTDRQQVRPVAATNAVVRLRKHIDRGRPDVVLAHGAASTRAAAIGRRRDGPLLVWKRISPAAWRPVQRWWWRAIARRVDAVVALTPQLETEMRGLGYHGPVWLIPNARRPERFLAVDRAAEAVRLRREIGIGDDVSVLGFVGSLSREKRPERTLDVLARVVAQGQPAHLVVAGDGRVRATFEREVRDRGLQESVTSLGHRPDIEQLFGGMDLLLITSDVEGIPGVAIEAQLAGCPVVTFPTGGVGAAVEDGVTGVVVDRPDTALMAEHVLDLLRHHERRERFGAEGRRRADTFSTARVADEYSARLTELYASRGSRTRQRANAGSSGVHRPPTS